MKTADKFQRRLETGLRESRSAELTEGGQSKDHHHLLLPAAQVGQAHAVVVLSVVYAFSSHLTSHTAIILLTAIYSRQIYSLQPP